MNIYARTIIALFVFFALYCFLYWIPFSAEPFNETTQTTCTLLSAGILSLFLWLKLKDRSLGPISCILVGAISLGAAGFSLGFFGPMLLVPEANQGPLLGIVFTGPGGFVLGGIAGFFYWKRELSKRTKIL